MPSINRQDAKREIKGSFVFFIEIAYVWDVIIFLRMVWVWD